MTFGTYAEEWLDVKKLEVGHSQLVAYKCCLKRLEPIFDTEIGEVTVKDIQGVITALFERNPYTGKPTAKKTLRDIKMTAKQVFEYAINCREISYNPANAVKIPRDAPKQTRRALTQDEMNKIIDTEHPLQTFSMIALFAGLRRGELLALTWDDIDLVNGSITVSKAVAFIRNQPIVKTPKTASGCRVVQIPTVLINYLKTINPKSGLVLGKIYTKTTWNDAWKKYIDFLNIPDVTPHMLRHTACTMMIEAGMDVSSVRLQMGHSDIQTTLAIYTHVTQQHRTNEVKKLDSYLKAEKKPINLPTKRDNCPICPQ